MEKQIAKTELPVDPDSLQMRRFCVAGLARAVPEFMSRAEAAECVSVWFPADQLAMQSLHRLISEQPIVA